MRRPARGLRAGWDQLKGRLLAEPGGSAWLQRTESWSVLASVKLGNHACLARIDHVPRLDLDVETSELQDPIAPRREVLRPLPRHSLAAHDEEAMAVGHDENRHIVRFAGLAPVGRERDLSIIFGGVDHVLAEGAYSDCNRSRAARYSTS